MAIKVRRGNKADLVIANLVAGEPVFALDTKEFGIKANDGTMVWVSTLDSNGKVPYANLSGVAAGTNGDANNALKLGNVLASTIIDGSGNAQNALKLGGNLASLYPTISSGVWTILLKGITTAGTPTYTTHSGVYYKVGRKVHIDGNVTLSAKGGIVGNLYMSGLPFVASGDSQFAITNVTGISGISGVISAMIGSGVTDISIGASMSSSGVTWDVTADKITDTFSIKFSTEYLTT